MSFSQLKSTNKEATLTKLVLKALQELGGQANRQDVREKILDENEDIAEYEKKINTSKKGNTYRPFDYYFNYSFNNLKIAKFADYSRSSRLVRLTENGIKVDINTLSVEQDIFPLCDEYWEKRKAEGKDRKTEEEPEDDEENRLVAYDDDFRNRLLAAIQKMSPKKFEVFSRQLLSKMGIEFTEKGTQISKDGGIDGYGYCRTDDFRTSRVVIQCKRWQNNVGSVEINGFLGAMNRFKADYGVFITNSHYTADARKAARDGTPITLLDGDDLVNLVKKYELYISPVQTYILDSFYDEE